MARIEAISRDEMTPEQIRVNDAISAKRGGGQAHGPFGIWLRTPALAEKAAVFGDHLRAELTLPQRLQEIAVLVVARHWTAQYEWFAHVRHAERLNIPAELIEAIRSRREPVIADAEDAIGARGDDHAQGDVIGHGHGIDRCPKLWAVSPAVIEAGGVCYIYPDQVDCGACVGRAREPHESNHATHCYRCKNS